MEETETPVENNEVVDAPAPEPDPAVDPEASADISPAPTPPTPPAPAAADRTPPAADPADIDIEAECDAKLILAERYEAGLITDADYHKQVAAHDKRIIRAQKALAQPARELQQRYKQQEQADRFWQDWGKGQDPASLEYGKKVGADRAAKLFEQAHAEIAADPRRANRPQMDRNTLVYDRWLVKLEAESTKKPGTPAPAPKAPTSSTRMSGSGSSSQQPSGRQTVRERQDSGGYDEVLRRAAESLNL